jgi:hypothetical protein
MRDTPLLNIISIAPYCSNKASTKTAEIPLIYWKYTVYQTLSINNLCHSGRAKTFMELCPRTGFSSLTTLKGPDVPAAPSPVRNARYCLPLTE